jgi:two-component system, OmpR family, response regulator
VRILVVEDEPYIADLVAMGLRYQGFDVVVVGSGREAVGEARRERPDLVILDVMLPDFDGLEVQRRLTSSDIDSPVIFLTARDAVEDRLAGLAVGDDYVTKPFSLEELIARVRAVLRRVAPSSAEAQRLQISDLVMDEDLHEVTRAGEIIELTPTEWKLLRFLMRNGGRVVSKARILDEVWEYDFGGEANVVETYVSYLRRKIDRSGEPLIHTVRGAGYAVRPPRS